MEAESAAPFEQLPMVRSGVPEELIGMYRVYKDEKNYSVVKAGSALEALQNSKLGHALRIERESFYKINLMNPTFWENETVAAPAAAPQEAAAAPLEAKAEEAPAAAVPSGESPLSNNDVDKLLNG